MDVRREIFYSESNEAAAKPPTEAWGAPFLGGTQSQAGRDLGQPDLVGGNPAPGRRLQLDGL